MPSLADAIHSFPLFFPSPFPVLCSPVSPRAFYVYLMSRVIHADYHAACARVRYTCALGGCAFVCSEPLLVSLRRGFVAVLAYNKAVHTSHGLPGINNIEPELILTG